MAISKAVAVTLLLSLLFHHLVEADEMNINQEKSSYPPKIDCGGACSGRCRLASRERMCMRACGTCCARCNCVPPGTSGNQNVCPCYASMTTHGGRRKCP